MRSAFGSAVVFTGGPGSAFVTTAYDPRTYGWVVVMSLATALIIWLCTVQAIGGSSRLFPRALCALLVIAGLGDREGLLLLVPFLCVLALVRAQSLLRCSLAVAGLSITAAIDISAKGSMFPLALVACLCAAFCAWHTGHRYLAPVAVIAPVLAFSVLWVAMGQRLTSVPAYVSGVVDLAQGYTEAMSWGSPGGDLPLFLVVGFVGLLAAISVVLVRGLSLAGRLALGCVLGFTVFTAMKLGFVRADQHMFATFSCVAGVIAISMAMTHRRPRTIVAGSGVLLAAATIYFLGSWALPAVAPIHQGEAVAGVAEALRRLGGARPALGDQWEVARANIVAESEIPRLEGRVDTYSYDQADVLARDLDWATRPVLQSYSAYSPRLAKLNQDHLTGAAAPNWVLFAPQAIDDRYPSIEDGPTWFTLLKLYRPTGFAGDKAILRRLEAPSGYSALSYGSTSTAELGQRIALSRTARLRFVQLNVKPSLLGQAALLLYKTQPLTINVWTADGLAHRFRLPAGMAESGFLLSPLTEDAEQFSSLYGDTPVVDAAREVVALRVDGSDRLWSSTFEYRESLVDVRSAP
ncbi:hypothetical protein [Terrabacter sp. NPDC080008]|uniref:hypothetical protein n=1 Tax=Terrabacter sp. NPDC080008 TaxID=3155176 RepID=UPI00344B9321